MDTGPQHATAPDVLEHAAVLWCLYSLLSAKLVSAEAAAGHPARDAATWNARTRLRDDTAAADTASLALDSLLFFDLAMTVSAFFQLTDSGIEDGLLPARTLGDWASLVLEARRRGARALAFSTSGSTGQPALHRHEWADMVAEVEAMAPMLDARTQGGLRRVVCCVPAHHILWLFMRRVVAPAP